MSLTANSTSSNTQGIASMRNVHGGILFYIICNKEAFFERVTNENVLYYTKEIKVNN